MSSASCSGQQDIFDQVPMPEKEKHSEDVETLFSCKID